MVSYNNNKLFCFNIGKRKLRTESKSKVNVSQQNWKSSQFGFISSDGGVSEVDNCAPKVFRGVPKRGTLGSTDNGGNFTSTKCYGYPILHEHKNVSRKKGLLMRTIPTKKFGLKKKSESMKGVVEANSESGSRDTPSSNINKTVGRNENIQQSSELQVYSRSGPNIIPGEGENPHKIIKQISKATHNLGAGAKSAFLTVFTCIRFKGSTKNQYTMKFVINKASEDQKFDVSGKVSSAYKDSWKPAPKVKTSKNAKVLPSLKSYLNHRTSNTCSGCNDRGEPTIKVRVRSVKHKHQNNASMRVKKTDETIGREQLNDNNLQHSQDNSRSQRSSKRSTRNRKMVKRADFNSKKEDMENAMLQNIMVTLGKLQGCMQHQTYCQSPIYQQLLKLNDSYSMRCPYFQGGRPKSNPRAWSFESVNLNGTFSVFLY